MLDDEIYDHIRYSIPLQRIRDILRAHDSAIGMGLAAGLENLKALGPAAEDSIEAAILQRMFGGIGSVAFLRLSQKTVQRLRVNAATLSGHALQGLLSTATATMRPTQPLRWGQYTLVPVVSRRAVKMSVRRGASALHPSIQSDFPGADVLIRSAPTIPALDCLIVLDDGRAWLRAATFFNQNHRPKLRTSELIADLAKCLYGVSQEIREAALLNTYPLIRAFYDSPAHGRVVELGSKAVNGATRSESMRAEPGDLRTEKYHRAGQKATRSEAHSVAYRWPDHVSPGLPPEPSREIPIEVVVPGTLRSTQLTKRVNHVDIPQARSPEAFMDAITKVWNHLPPASPSK